MFLSDTPRYGLSPKKTIMVNCLKPVFSRNPWRTAGPIPQLEGGPADQTASQRVHNKEAGEAQRQIGHEVGRGGSADGSWGMHDFSYYVILQTLVMDGVHADLNPKATPQKNVPAEA